MTTTTSATDDGLPGISLAEWLSTMRRTDPKSRFADAVDVVVSTPNGEMDAIVLLGDPYLFASGRHDMSIASRLVGIWGDDVRVIYPDIEKGVCET